MPNTTHTVVARFDEPGSAREAMVDLEGRGIDADAINLIEHSPSVPTREGGLHTDLTVSRRFIESYARNGIVGALIGAVVFTLGLLLIGVDAGMAVGFGVVLGLIAGFAMGGFIGAARHIPVNEDAFETYAMDPSAAEGIAVEVKVDDPDQAAKALAVLRTHHPRQVERRAA
jgi:hypothetical protein